MVSIGQSTAFNSAPSLAALTVVLAVFWNEELDAGNHFKCPEGMLVKPVIVKYPWQSKLVKHVTVVSVIAPSQPCDVHMTDQHNIL